MAKAQRTPLQALQHILTEYTARRLNSKTSGKCMYQYSSGNHCGVGSLFTEAQLKDIRARGHNEHSISHVAEKIGKKNIEFVTGLHLSELTQIQNMNDDESNKIACGSTETRLYKYLTNRIAGLRKK